MLEVGAPDHVRAELIEIARGEVGVAGLVGELHDRAGPEPAFEVVEQEDLRGPADLFEGRWHGGSS